MKRQNNSKERIIMISSSVFVLAALTMTGVYVRNASNKQKNDGYSIDFSVLEQEQTEQEENSFLLEQPGIGDEDERYFQNLDDDLDYLPMEQVDSATVEIPGLTMPETTEMENDFYAELAADQEAMQADALGLPGADEELTEENAEGLEGADGVSISILNAGEDIETAPVISDYTVGEPLAWPISGNVLIPFSMSKTVFFPTLLQYKYNPALIVAANEGDAVSAVASGTVISVSYLAETGNTLVMDIGGGYQVTYGQLKDIPYSVGAHVDKDAIVGYIDKPTKYYSTEGTNAYFALTLNGQPVDPLSELR